MKISFNLIRSVSRALILSLVTSSLGGSLFAVEIYGHRGASFDAPENSLSSMKLAWKQNADGIETDIHLSKDGHIVISHDFDTKRTAGVDKKIADQTWEELRQLDIGKWKGEKFAGEKMPTLESFFDTIPDGKRILIEIKVKDSAAGAEFQKAAEILPELEKSMKASGKTPSQLWMITFHYEMAKAAKERFPKHEVYWLVGWNKNKKTGEYPNIDELIPKAKAAKVNGLSLNYGFPVDKAFVQKVHKAGLKLYTWTVDDPAIAQQEIEVGVDGITTNRPQFIRDHLKK